VSEQEDSGQGGRPSSTRRGAIGDVAAELRALRRTLRETDEITRESAGLLAETAPKVAALEEQVATLHGQVTALVDDAENTAAEDPGLTAAKAAVGLRSDPPGPWCWPLLDRQQAETAWDALGRWVGELLVPTYGITRLQLFDCWPHHPAMLAQLTWLRQGYLEAHLPGAPATKAQDWHLRSLPGVLAALPGLVPTEAGTKPEPLCAPGRHLQKIDYSAARAEEYDQARMLPATVEHWGPAWREAMTADLTHRRPAPDK
jgi:hypothetical protein